MRTILIADEDVRTRNLVRLIFTEHMGYKVIATSGGADAVLMAREIVPDIVLVDASSNQNGYKVSREIKNDLFLKNTPVILLTSAFAAFEERKVLGAYADDVIIKPFEPEEIIKKVKSLINKPEKIVVEPDPLVQTEGISKHEGSPSFRSLGKKVVDQKKPNYPESFESILQLFAKTLKSFYGILKGHVKSSKAIRKLKELETFPKTVLKARSFKVSPLHLDKRIYPLFILWPGTIFQCLVKGLGYSYQASKGYAENFKAAVKKIKGKRVAPQIPIKTRPFKIPSPHLSKSYYLITLVSLGIILPATMLVVLADMKGVEEKLKLDGLLTGAAERNELTTEEVRSRIIEEIRKEVKEKETLEGEKVKASQLKKEKTLEEPGKVEVKGAKKETLKPREITKERLKISKYIVKKGDSLWRIAHRFNISVKDLRIANDLKGDRLGIGDPLIIPLGKPKQVLKNEATKGYVKRRVLAQERSRDEEKLFQPKTAPEDFEDIRRKYMRGYVEHLKKTRSELGMSDRGILGPQ